MDEDVTAAYFLQENAFCCIVEEAGIVPGDVVVEVEDETKGEVLDAGKSSTRHTYHCS